MFELNVYPKHKATHEISTLRCILPDHAEYVSIGVQDAINHQSAGIIVRDPVHLRQLAAWATGAAAYLESMARAEPRRL